jgi:DNA-binding transcriptional MerR regulator
VGERSYLSIGDVLALLREEFPDITISKIRFLESRGLLVPERTPSGYRKFYDHDVERLRWILRQQREHFLPLKVIKGRLEGADAAQPESLFDAGEPPPPARAEEELAKLTALRTSNGSHPSVGPRLTASQPSRVATLARSRETELAPVHAVESKPESPAREKEPARPETQHPAATRPEPQVPLSPEHEKPARSRTATVREGLIGSSLTPAELAQVASLTVTQVEQLEAFGLIEGRTVAGVHCYDEEAAEVAKLAAGFAAFGIEARHLRIFKHAAERQAGLFSQVVMPLLRQRNPQARTRAEGDLAQMAELGSALQAAFLRSNLSHLTGR